MGTNDLYRGRARTRRVEPSEFSSAAFYLSGLTFQIAFVRDYVSQVKAQIPANSAVTVYPQVALAAHCVAAGRSWFLDEVVTAQAESLPTEITDPSGVHYAHVAGRWANFLGYEQFFADAIGSSSNEKTARLAMMRDAQRAGLPRLLLGAAKAEVPALESAIDQVLYRRTAIGRILKALRRRG